MGLRDRVLATMKSRDTEGAFELYVTRTPGFCGHSSSAVWACIP